MAGTVRRKFSRGNGGTDKPKAVPQPTTQKPKAKAGKEKKGNKIPSFKEVLKPGKAIK